MARSRHNPIDGAFDAASLRFRRWKTPAGVRPSAIFLEPQMCGIYILEFANGERYVGKTVHLPTRFGDHRRTWDDIVAVNFAAVLPEHLDQAERAWIAAQVTKFTLRNLTLLSQPLGSSPFDLVVDREKQADWLTATPESVEVEVNDQRVALAQRRIRSRAQFEKLRAHPRYEQVLASVATYVALVIPWPEQTEGRSWTLTALPATSKRPDHRRPVTLSIHTVEMLYLGEWRENDEWLPYSVLNTAMMQSVPAELAGLTKATEGYRSAGRLQRFDLDGHDVLGDVLSHPSVLRAARSLALGQLRKGRGVLSRFHNDAFTDEVFAQLGRG